MPRNLTAKLTRSTNQIGKITLNGVSDAATPEEIRNYAMLFGKLFPDRVQWEAPEQTASAITIVNAPFDKATSVESGAKVKPISGLLGERSPKPLFYPARSPHPEQTVKLPAKGTKIFAILTSLLSNPGTTVTEMSRALSRDLNNDRKRLSKITNALVSSYSKLLDRVRKPSNLRDGAEVWCYSLKPEVAEAVREALKV